MASSLNKVQGARAAQRLDFRTTRDGVIPSSVGALHRLTLDAAMKAALTHAGAKLVVEMDAGGTRVLLADGRTNQLIGGPDDLQKLGSIRAFVNRERKDAASVEAAKDVTQLAFLGEKVVKEKDKDFIMNPVDNSFGAAVRPLKAALDQSVENMKRLGENTSTKDREFYEPYLRRYFLDIGNAYTRTISALIKGETIKGRLASELFSLGIPEWVHSRFVSRTFVLERTGDLRKLLFPADPSKGLALTAKEWRDVGFVKAQGQILRDSHLVGMFVRDDELIRAITGIAPSISLDDEENPLSAKMLKAKLVAMPLADNADRVIELGSKTRSGFKFPSPSMDTVSGAMTALSTALLRVYAANLQSVDLVSDYYATIVPNTVSKEAVTPTNNFYVQWSKAANKDATWLQAIKGGPEDLNLRQKVWRWLRMELRFSEDGNAGQALANSLLLEEDGKMPDHGHSSGKVIVGDGGSSVRLPELDLEEKPPVLMLAESVNITRPLNETELPFWNQFQQRVFPRQAGKKGKAVGLSLTPVTPQGKQLLSRVKIISPYVADRMHQWLRSFSDERLQLAAIKVTNAEFDDIFTSVLDAEDDTAESELDWAEQEA